ncbi:MAG: hypothetical protein GY838_09910, partial [bacterium]|nr:hypothetical protein [bacterium]
MRKSNTHLMRLSRNPIVLLAVLWALASPIHGQVEAALDQAEAWLLGQQRPDGSFATVERLAPRDSALAVLALHDRDPAGQAVTQGLIYLTGVPEANSYFRTHRILALAQAGRDFQSLLESLLDFRNGGGMGAFLVHQPNVLGTGFGVEALAEDELSHQLDIVGLLDYLQLHQNTDGGWGFLSGEPSEVYYTAEILDAMAQLKQLAVGSGVLSSAAGFLAARQQANSSFGTIVETAVAYRALLATGFAPADLPFGSPVPYLLAQQQADGSWEGNAFVTAQVMRVLHGELPNLIVTEVTATPQTATPGTLVRISITVRNIGPVAADAGYVAVRLDTTAGEELAEVALPALAAGATTTLEVDVDTTDQTGDALDLVAVADSREELAELDETDNTATVRVTLQSGPDLALFPSDLSLSPAEPRPGEDFELLVQVRNLGKTEVASFDYRVSELIAGVPVELLASGSDGPIDAAGGRLLTIPLNLAEGEHSLEVEIDPEHLVEEESDNNNLASLSFFVVDASQPDLALLDAELVLDPPQPAAGETVAVDLTLHNFGSRDATVELELHEDGPADGSALQESWTLTVAAGDAVAVSTSAVVSADAYALTAVVDPDQAIPELDESNNRVRRVFRDLPDLAIGFDNFEFLPAQPLEGEPVEVSVTVRNAGTAAAADVALEVFSDSSDGGDPGAGGSSVFTHVFAAIPPAANRRVSFTWTAVAGLTTLVAEVDADAVIPEFSETNNRAEREVAVPRSSGPDLVVATIDPSGLNESAEALSVAGPVAIEIANLGDADVNDPFLVRLFVDANGDGRLTSGESVLASTVVSDPIAAGGTLAATLAVDASVPFFHPLVWAEVDSGDVVAEQREDNNRAILYGDCATTPPAGAIEPEEEWFVPGIEVETAPIVVQLSDDNGDGAIDSRDTPDVVVHAVDAEGNVLLALSGLDGSELWSFRSTPANPLVMQLGQVAAADLDGDGVAEVLGLQRDGRMIALEHDGRLRWVSEPVEGVGNRSLGGPSVGDLDADGVPEIVIGRAVLSNTGELIALGTANRGRNYNYYGPLGTVLVPGTTDYPHSLIADVDLDGINEIVAGDAVYRLVDGTLEVVWDQVVPDKLMVDGFSAVGNLDADPEAEIVYVSSNHIQVLNHDG